MIKVKTFVIKNSNNICHPERLDNYINNFLAENDIEVVDIKYSTAMAVLQNSEVYIWKPSAMLIYKEKDNG